MRRIVVNDNCDVRILRARECQQARAELLESMRPMLLRHATPLIDPRINRRVDENDVVQQVILDATHDFDQFRGANLVSLKAWLQQITNTTIQDLVRKHIVSQKRSVNKETKFIDDSSNSGIFSSSQEPSTGTPTPRTRMIDDEKSKMLFERLSQLPDSQREAVTLRYFENLPVKVVAERLGKTLEATGGLLKRGLNALRELTAEDDLLQ